MKTLIPLHLILALVATVFAQNAAGQTAEIRQVSVGLNGDNVTIDVNLTEAVIPTVLIASNPDRLVLQLPNTAAPAKQQAVTVNQNGVKGVRVGLNQAAPPIARVVVDLNTVHPYQLAMNGTTITLTVLPMSLTLPLSQLGTGGGLIARLWRRPSNAASSSRGATGGGPIVLSAQQATRSLRTKFMVKYVAEGAAYLNGGRGAGLVPGMKLAVRDPNLSARGATAQDPP